MQTIEPLRAANAAKGAKRDHAVFGLPFFRKFMVELSTGWNRETKEIDVDNRMVTIAKKKRCPVADKLKQLKDVSTWELAS